MEKKYKLTEETINVGGTALYRIEALRDFGDVKKGDKGGFIEKESNLSQSGDCWVYDDAKVYSSSIVYGDAKVCDNARVYDNAIVTDHAKVYNNAMVYGYARVYANANIYGDALVHGKANVSGNAMVCDNTKIFGNAEVYDDAIIESTSDYIVFKNWWSSGRYFTWTKSNNMWKVGCFYGTGEELIEKAYKDSEKSGREYERVVRYVESIIKDYHK